MKGGGGEGRGGAELGKSREEDHHQGLLVFKSYFMFPHYILEEYEIVLILIIQNYKTPLNFNFSMYHLNSFLKRELDGPSSNLITLWKEREAKANL